MPPEIGKKVTGTILSVQGECACGHKAGDKFQLSCYTPNGLCGFFYHDIFPYVQMLQFGGKFPGDWGGDVLEFACPDLVNATKIQLRAE